MDWEKLWDILKKVAVISNIGAFVLAVVWFLYEIWPSSPSRWRAFDFDTEAGMRPSLIIGGCLVLASIFNLLAFSISRRKRKLQKQIAVLETDLEHERGKPQLVPNGALNAEINAAKKTIKELQETHRIALTTANLEKTKVKTELENEKKLKASLEGSYAISRREVKEARAETRVQSDLNKEIWDAKVTSEAQLAEAKEAVEQLSKELAQSKSKAENERKRANYETSQREEFLKLYHAADHQLAIWKPITEHAKTQAAQIDEWVRMKEAIPAKLLLKRRLVTLKIRIYNESLYPVRILPKAITGQLRFKGIPLREEIQTPADEPAIEVEPRGTGIIKLLQPLRVFEADNIRESREGGDNDALFWLGDVYIPISAKDTATRVATKPLIIIPDHISLDVHAFSYNEKPLDTSDIS
jgi:hypothetical protein